MLVMSKSTLTNNRAYGNIIYNGNKYSISFDVMDNRDNSNNRFRLQQHEFEISNVTMVKVTNNK